MVGGAAYVLVVRRVAGDRRDPQPLDEVRDEGGRAVGSTAPRTASTTPASSFALMGRTLGGPRSAASTSVGPVRVATFNLLHGRSVAHGGVDVEDLRAAAAEIDADVVGLQEVDRHQERSGVVDQTAEVAAALGAEHWRFAPSLNGTPGADEAWTRSRDDDGATTTGPTYGVGLVSRLPVRSWEVRRFGPAPVSACR